MQISLEYFYTEGTGMTARHAETTAVFGFSPSTVFFVISRNIAPGTRRKANEKNA